MLARALCFPLKICHKFVETGCQIEACQNLLIVYMGLHFASLYYKVSFSPSIISRPFFSCYNYSLFLLLCSLRLTSSLDIVGSSRTSLDRLAPLVVGSSFYFSCHSYLFVFFFYFLFFYLFF